jgi:obg-like ATPase 1
VPTPHLFSQPPPLPSSSQSTLFNALCENAKAAAANFPFCTIEPNVGLVTVPDARLEALSTITKSKAIIPTVVEFVDIAGLVKGAASGEGLGNQFLANIRECDAIVQVVRCFEDENVIHVSGAVDPTEDADIINFELALADYAQVEKRLTRLAKGGRSRSKEEAAAAEIETAALTRIAAALEAGQPARGVPLTEEEAGYVRLLQLLTAKPMIYAANVAEGDLADGGASNKHVAAVTALAAKQGCELTVVSAQVEAELRDLEPAEAAEYLADLGAPDGGGLSSLIRAAYEGLGLMTYFTTGEKETRAWTVRRGATAPEAAAVIHSSFLKLFIRAEAISFDDFVKHNGAVGAKEAGVQRLEGKEYVVAEGDVLLFRTG